MKYVHKIYDTKKKKNLNAIKNNKKKKKCDGQIWLIKKA